MKRKQNMSKKILFLLSGMLFSGFAFAQTGVKVTYYDGTTQSFAVQDSGKLYFSGSNLMVQAQANATATSLPMSIIQKINFETASLSVENISSTTKKLLVYPNPAEDFFAIKTETTEKMQVKIFSASGRLVKSASAKSGEYIYITELPKGVYIVVANNESFKLIKK